MSDAPFGERQRVAPTNEDHLNWKALSQLEESDLRFFKSGSSNNNPPGFRVIPNIYEKRTFINELAQGDSDSTFSENEVAEMLRRGDHVFLQGQPGEGKSRAMYYILILIRDSENSDND